MPAFVTLARSCLGFCLLAANPNVAHPQLFPSHRKSIWTSRKHIFCSRLPSCTLAPKFHASPSLFSLICSWTWFSLVAPLHCDHTSHTDYVWLPAVGLPWRSRVLYTTWCFLTYLWIAMCIRTHVAHVAVEILDHSPNFLDTPCMHKQQTEYKLTWNWNQASAMPVQYLRISNMWHNQFKLLFSHKQGKYKLDTSEKQ